MIKIFASAVAQETKIISDHNLKMFIWASNLIMKSVFLNVAFINMFNILSFVFKKFYSVLPV